MAGLPAAAVLGLLAGTSNRVDGVSILRYLGRYDDNPAAAAFAKHNAEVALVGAVFWSWAAVTAATAHFDLGVLTFAGAVGGAAYGLSLVRAGASTRRWRWLAPGACASVALNYVLGMCLVSAPTLLLYFGLAALMWAGAALRGRALSGDLGVVR